MLHSTSTIFQTNVTVNTNANIPEDDGEQAGSADVEESREDKFFRNLSEHFSAQARRK